MCLSLKVTSSARPTNITGSSHLEGSTSMCSSCKMRPFLGRLRRRRTHALSLYYHQPTLPLSLLLRIGAVAFTTRRNPPKPSGVSAPNTTRPGRSSTQSTICPAWGYTSGRGPPSLPGLTNGRVHRDIVPATTTRKRKVFSLIGLSG